MQKPLHLLFFLILVFTFGFSLIAQEIIIEPEEDEAVLGVFPIGLVLKAAENADMGSWQPDWPPDFPADAFWICRDKNISVTVYDELNSLSLKWINGHISEFPWVFQGSLIQVSFDYSFVENDVKPFIDKIYISGIADIEVLEYLNDNPYLLRVQMDENYAFAYLQWGTNILVESWFDIEGNFIEQYVYSYLYGANGQFSAISKFTQDETETRGYDSRFLLTEISSIEGFYSVNYFQDYLPRYWRREDSESAAQILSFQWDNNDLLLRLSADNGTTERVDSVYEYLIDERGNWIERHETKMTGNSGLLLPGPGKIFRRLIDYGDD